MHEIAKRRESSYEITRLARAKERIGFAANVSLLEKEVARQAENDAFLAVLIVSKATIAAAVAGVHARLRNGEAKET